MPCDVARERAQGEVAYHFVADANGVPVITSGLVESSQQEIDEVVRLITKRAAGFTIVPASYMLTVVTLTHTFRTRLGAELKAIANKNKAMGMFLRHVRIVDISDVAGAHATDAILAMCYAKTSHGRLLQQFGALESEGGRGMLLDALAVPDRHLDIVSAFSSADMDDERLHQAGPKMLKTVLRWAEQLDDRAVVHGLDVGDLGTDGTMRVFERGNDRSFRARRNARHVHAGNACRFCEKVPLAAARPFVLDKDGGDPVERLLPVPDAEQIDDVGHGRGIDRARASGHDDGIGLAAVGAQNGHLP